MFSEQMCQAIETNITVHKSSYKLWTFDDYDENVPVSASHRLIHGFKYVLCDAQETQHVMSNIRYYLNLPFEQKEMKNKLF